MEAPPPHGSVRCTYCLASLVAAPGGWRPAALDAPPEPVADPELPRMWVGGARYALVGRMARGEGTDVLLARRDARVTERVVVKALRAERDADLLAHEAQVLESLARSKAQGAPHFSRVVPQLVTHGMARLGNNGRDGERLVTVLRFTSGFVHTLEAVRKVHGQGVGPETSVWLWKRTLETLGWAHRSGWVHGAVLPAHLIVHARDHGVLLVGWSRAVASGRGSKLAATTETARAFYPDDVWQGAPATTATDVAMSARAVLFALGAAEPASGRAPGSVPAPLAELLAREARSPSSDAWAVRDALDHAAEQAFGPPRYVPLPMPGWR